MYRVMIVEDEPPIMRAVKSAIERSAADFEAVQCVKNGKEAVQYLENESVDLIVTDIKMPVMTGLELAQWVKENRHEIPVVILSGYQDFEYARKALEYKVFDYLLKPISREKVKGVLDRVRDELSARKPEKKTCTDDSDTVVVLMCAGAYLLHGANVLMPGEKFWVDDKTQKMLKEILKADEEYIFFNTNRQSERFLVIASEGAARQEEIVKALFDMVTEGELPVTLVYKKSIKFKDAGASFSELREQLIKRLVLGKAQLAECGEQEERFENIGAAYSKRDIELTATAIKARNKDAVKERLSEIIEQMRSVDNTQEDISAMLNIVVDSYTLSYPAQLQRHSSSVKNELMTAIAGFTTYELLIDDVTSILMTLSADKKSEDRHGKLADEIEEYLISNFNKQITNDVLAKKFGFVPSYMSRIFKKSKGVSPSEYITKYRIQTAMRLLEENPNMMIKQAADMVGFKEAYYFSKTFKRETGMWPTEFVGGKEEKCY